eukprot:gb/GFBE01080819.1/.p1 GENE.gb/GFBE01080819.1/~~gb/GFBE01080819.1/.p1  ORF type:complete len:941 (+),score=238.72 gb/GFBE01080819.1/:1-2823(+)
MGCCCGSEKPEHTEAKDRFEKGGQFDLSDGPAKNRGCTDAWCLIVLLTAWIAYIGVTFAGFTDGNPAKLYLPRDYSGAYCDTETNWNKGPNTKGFKYLSYTMNTTTTTDLIVKQLVCSSAARTALVSGYIGVSALLTTQDAKDDYLCDCCLVPCSRCTGSLEVGGDLSLSNLEGTISSKMTELRGSTSAGSLFSPGGANLDVFTNMWAEATKYFNKVCLPDCNTNFAKVNSSESRPYTYSMAADNALSKYWELLKNRGPASIKDTISSQFTFKALPPELCPYNESKCVPFPGVEFGDMGNGYCSFSMAEDVVNSVGKTAADTFVSIGGNSFQEGYAESLGQLFGDFLTTIDAFILVSLCTFIIGFVFLILLRFFIGICVWLAVFLALVLIFLGGAFCFVKSYQCAGASLLDTGTQITTSVAVSAQTAAESAAAGDGGRSEAMTGDGANYVGVQYRTKMGKTCLNWGEGNAAAYTTAAYPDSHLEKNYCRNPYKDNDRNKAGTIWCFTTDSEVLWQECLPVGVLAAECENGYAVSTPELREVLRVCAYIIWALAGIYLLLVCLFQGRIRLAIAVNKVACIFMSQSPLILLVPIGQAFISITWHLIWALSATFLISQVPADWTPTGAYATYAEAYGTNSTPGKCTDKWPTGFVYKDEDTCDLVNGTWACYRCAPPRYVFDVRFAISFFVFLWNNALQVAVVQCVIAGAVGIWFFTPNEEKGSRKIIAPSMYNVFRYHLGSLAFGSFIIALVEFIRYVMKYYEKQAQAQKNRVMVMILKICQCCMWCLEKCLKFLNKNAYIQIALMGTNFCVSAKKAFFLILRNAVRFGMVAMLGSMIHSIGFFFITVASVALGYVISTGLHPDVSPAINMVVYFCVAYEVAGLFMSVFGLAVDSTLQCFLACEEMGLGGNFVPPCMQRWLNSSGDVTEHDKKLLEKGAEDAE